MRIAITADPMIPVPPLQYGGIERIVHMLVEGLVDRGHDVVLFAHPDSDVRCRLVPYHGATAGHAVDVVRNTLAVSRLLRERPDLVHSFGRLAYLTTLLPSGIPKIMSYQREPAPRQIRRAMRLASDSTLSFTACSGHIARRIPPLAPVSVIPNGVPIADFHPAYEVGADAPLVFLGRIERIKGVHTAIGVANAAGRRLIIAGNVVPGDEGRRYFETEVLPHVGSPHVEYVGPVDDRQKDKLLGSAAALLMPVDWEEPFGIVMTEALACGTPVIGFARGAVPEIVRDGVTGFLCADANAMVEAVRRLPELDRRACREDCVRRFSDRVVVDAYEELYRKRVGIRRGGGSAADRKVIIVAPHFPPSNLASVHRSRLLAKHLPQFGWEPTVVSVHHRHYEEQLDWNLAELVPDRLRVERVRALPTHPLRLVGDIGVRGWLPMLLRILRITASEKIDFLYITIPSNYASLLGRVVHALRGVPYGIDYIDPWVHRPPGSERVLTKAWLTARLAALLEPTSLKRASLIAGVADLYYEDALARNPHLRRQSVTVSMPYGGERGDHEKARELGIRPYVFPAESGVFRLVYAGAMLPRARGLLDAMLSAVASQPALFSDVRLHFIGTGTSPDDPDGYNVRPLAERHRLWRSVVLEHPARIPYLDVLAHLDAADGVLLLGSTERHYTPSKVFQAVLSRTPILAILHRESTACDVIRNTGAGIVLAFGDDAPVETIGERFSAAFREFRAFARRFEPDRVDVTAFEQYTARASASLLASALDRAIALEGRD